jgi:hypothetical protein
MPTFHIGGFKMQFYSNDHAPAHVHCVNGDGIVVVNIESGTIRKRIGGISDRDVFRALDLVAEHRDRLLHAWKDFEERKVR